MSEQYDDVPLHLLPGLPDLPEFEMGIKLEPPTEPVTLPDGTSLADVNNPPERPCRQARVMREFKCRICDEVFKTRWEHAIHVNKHTIRCLNCKCEYKSFRALEDHEQYCPRRFGRILITPRDKPFRRPKLPFKCSLCNRRYAKYAHLFDHQVKRCKRRYLTPGWVVKI